jgi:hypothetical protein
MHDQGLQATGSRDSLSDEYRRTRRIDPATFSLGAWRPGQLMQIPLHFFPRSNLLTVCVLMVAAISLLAAGGSEAQSSPVAAGIKQCRHHFAGKGRKTRQAKQRCIKKAWSKKRPQPASSTEASTPAPAPQDAASSSPTPGDDAEAVAPPAPVTPIGPSAPEAPPPLELEMPRAAVVIGSAINLNPPSPLTALSAIESTTGSEPGVTLEIEGGHLVISASTEAVPALLHLVIGGTACLGSECGRQVFVRLQLTVQPTIVPLVEVDANGPTSGPAGFGPQVITPSCSYLTYGFENGARGAVSTLRPRETFNTHTPPTLSTGPSQIWFECLTGRGGPSVWRSTGFEITVTGASIPIGLESTTVPAGGEVVFTSGPSLSAAQCPTLPGVTVDELLLDLEDSSSVVNHRNVPMPDGLATEGVVAPPGSAAGTYSVFDRCIYGNLAGESAIYEFGQPNKITVTAG